MSPPVSSGAGWCCRVAATGAHACGVAKQAVGHKPNNFCSGGSPLGAICGRGDLVSSHPKAYGCYDTKVTRWSMALQRKALGGGWPAAAAVAGEGGLPLLCHYQRGSASRTGLKTALLPVIYKPAVLPPLFGRDLGCAIWLAAPPGCVAAQAHMCSSPPPTLHTHTINDPCTRPASLDGMLWLALACLGPALAAVVGPTTDGGRLPPFDWSEHKHLASQTQHIGQPSRFDFAFELLTPDDSRWARSGRHAGGPSHSLGKHHRPLEQQQSSADSDAATSAGSLVRTALRWRAVAQRAAGAAAAHSDDAEGS